MPEVTDHAGRPVTHGRTTVNGVRLHHVTAGSGPPLVLLHGVPKTWYYWHRVIPLLSERFTVIAPDVRGFGDSARPDGGYDMGTIATDVAELMTALGYERFAVAGEDWGAAFAYAVAASYPGERQLPRPDGVLDHAVGLAALDRVAYAGAASLKCHGTAGWPLEKVTRELRRADTHLRTCFARAGIAVPRRT